MQPWWKEQVLYQIYPRSFQDSNGDGIGDLPGIISRLDELQKLGIGILWLSPIYPSPDADNGYDISNYRDIDPRYGNLEDMDRLLAEAKARNIRVLMDLVVNHTSDEHEWFQQSRNPKSPYRDYYIWRPAKEDGSLPNNWTSIFDGPAWEYDEQSGEYYLHLFDKKQPDLNYHNPDVIREVKEIMRFWLDRGVAGFRCDVIDAIYKTSLEDGEKRDFAQGIEHYKAQEGNHLILKELRKDVLDHYDCFTVGEAMKVTLEEGRLLSDPDRRELDMIIYFDHLEADAAETRFDFTSFRADHLLGVLTKWQQGLNWNAVYLESHDQPRIVSHYGDDGVYWERSAKLLGTLEMTLRGTPFIYQGQEIGMTNFDFTDMSQLNDVASLNASREMEKAGISPERRWEWIKRTSRDNARTPMQWSDAPNAGFTPSKPWLSVNQNYTRINYRMQENQPDSILQYYRRLIDLRRNSETLKYGEFTPVYSDKNIMVYARTLGAKRYLVLLNFSVETVEAAYQGTVMISNTGITEYNGKLTPWEAVVLRVDRLSMI